MISYLFFYHLCLNPVIILYIVILRLHTLNVSPRTDPFKSYTYGLVTGLLIFDVWVIISVWYNFDYCQEIGLKDDQLNWPYSVLNQ